MSHKTREIACADVFDYIEYFTIELGAFTSGWYEPRSI